MSVVLASTILRAADAGVDESSWPQFRGPNATGVAALGKYPRQFGPDSNVRWKTGLPGGVSSPCVRGDRIFLTGFDKAAQTLETICLDRATGKVLWRQPAPAEIIEKVQRVSSPANATPATDGERVYVYFASFGLLCYDLAGQLVWKKPLPLVQSQFGSGTSPIVAEGKVVLVHDEAEKAAAYLLAVDSRTGVTVWQTPRAPSRTKYSTPVHHRDAKGDQILVLGGQRLVSYDLRSGREQWWVNKIPPQLIGVPLVNGGSVFFSATGMFGEPENIMPLPTFDELLGKSGGGEDGLILITRIPKDVVVVDRRASGGAGNSALGWFAFGIDKNSDGKISREEWEESAKWLTSSRIAGEPAVCCVRLGGEGDVAATHLAWHETRGVPEVPSLLCYQDRLYGVRNGGFVHCRNARDGREIYSERLGAPGGYYASPVAGDGKVYVASDRGVVVVLAAGDKFDVLARNDLKERIVATPALADGVLYVRTDSALHAFADGP